MNIQELQGQIKNKSLLSYYIFLGDEIAVQKIYIKKIAEVTGLEIQYVDDYKSIHNKLKSNDIFNTKKLYIILDDTDFIKQEKLWTDFDNTKFNDNILIFKFNTLDKRNKFYKYFENKIVEFNKLSDEILIKYIRKELTNGTTLNDENCKKLISMCGNNYNQILLEIDKIKHYYDYWLQGGASPDNNIVFNVLNEQGAFHKEISDITFEFVEKVLKRDIKAVYVLRNKLRQINESNIKLLSLLYTNFKIVLLLQSCQSNDICKTTGLQYYQVKFNQDKVDFYTVGELVNILRKIQSIEKGIKTGTIDEIISLDYLLVNIL